MDNNNNDIMSLEDKARIELSLRTREAIIAAMMAGGKPPEATGDRVFLISALDGLDRTILTKAKIKSDDSAAKTQQSTARLISEVLSRIDVRKVATGGMDPNSTPLPTPEIVDGETYIGVANVRYSDIMGEEA